VRRLLDATTRDERLLAVALLLGYVVLAALLWRGKDFSENGVLAYEQPAASTVELAALGTSAPRVQRDCFGG